MATIDLGGAPSNEDCAQLGQTRNFVSINILEIRLYRAAILARYGIPPSPIWLTSGVNHHDFGTYRTLVAEFDETKLDDAGRDYIREVEDGLRSWIEAGFAPPITYRADRSADTHGLEADDIIHGAMMSTRPNPDGSYFPETNQALHENLKAAFPAVAARLQLPCEA